MSAAMSAVGFVDLNTDSLIESSPDLVQFVQKSEEMDERKQIEIELLSKGYLVTWLNSSQLKPPWVLNKTSNSSEEAAKTPIGTEKK
jgi:hypothetical protein